MLCILDLLPFGNATAKGNGLRTLGSSLVLVESVVEGEVDACHLRFFLPEPNRNLSLRGERNFDALFDREKGAFEIFLINVQVSRNRERSRRTL